jgi:hypothetical protein
MKMVWNTTFSILDINKDGKPDLLTYTWFESSSYDSELDGLDYQEEDSLILSVWNQGKMISQTVIDTVLQKELMRFFPTEGENSVDAHLENKLVGLLENDMKVEVSKFYNYKWGIVIGSDKTLEAAHFEGEKAKKLLQSNKKNNFRWNNLAFYSKTNRYYTVFSTFKTKEDAEKALPEIKKLIRKDAYIINEKKWCPKFKYNKNLCECD